MITERSARHAQFARWALIVGPLFAAACGSGTENASRAASTEGVKTGSSASATHYSYEVFDVPGATRTLAFAINERGDITGHYRDASGVQHAYIRRAEGDVTPVDIPGVAGITLRGINSQGVTVGFYSIATAGGPNELTFHGFERTPEGIITTVDFPGAGDSALLAINDSGGIAGQYDLGDQSVGGSFTLIKGQFVALPDPPGAAPFNVFADGINNLGDVSGSFIGVDGNQTAFLLRGGTYTTFSDAGATVTAFSRLNNHGQVPGVSDVSGGFVLDAQTLSFSTFIACPSGGATFPGGINNRGQVVGSCSAPDGHSQGFVATPSSAGD